MPMGDTNDVEERKNENMESPLKVKTKVKSKVSWKPNPTIHFVVSVLTSTLTV